MPLQQIKNKGIVKKSSTSFTDYVPTTSKSPSSSKTLIIYDTMEYNIMEDMKKFKSNISLYEVRKLKQH